MEKNMGIHLFQVAAQTFEELAFMFTDTELNEDQSKARFEAGAQLHFTGPFRGKLVLHLYGDLLSTLTRNLLAEDDEPDKTLQDDTLKVLDTFLVAFLDPGMHPHTVTDLEVVAFRLQLFLRDFVDDGIHFKCPG